MKYDLNRNELIEAYINGELSKRNTIEFEDLMQKDHRLKTEVAQFKVLFNGLEQLRERELLQEKFNKWDAKIDRKKTPYKKWLCTAATVAILISSYIVFNSTQNTETLFTAYFEAYPNVVSPINRSGNANDGTKEKMMFLYESENYSELIPMMEAQTESAQWNFYLGMSYLASNQTTAAIEKFDRIGKHSDFYHQKLWYQSLAYLKNNQKENCALLLQEIVSKKSFRHKKAILLLDEI